MSRLIRALLAFALGVLLALAAGTAAIGYVMRESGFA